MVIYYRVMLRIQKYTIQQYPNILYLVLNVHKPELILQLGTTTISLDTIQEGNDIYFDCILDANPMPTTPLIWRFNDEILEPKQGNFDNNINNNKIVDYIHKN
ncbi:hypothetical protein BLA29_001668 [Euroglyphus maynei]|uniref:Ig-like domain-containing protein n=1 Tax=Euroglyphus maynei TaxID=6958 RepID=A0A1Y3AUT4_EURMA|nr:hypothetical protein BLA29_001668 [Euroglyphus maynei]